MLCAIIMASRISGVFAVLGGTIGVLTAIAMGAPEAEIAEGLWGYDATLAAICVGGMFFRLSRRICVLAVLAALQAVLLHGALRAALFPVALPPLTVAAALTCLFVCDGRPTLMLTMPAACTRAWASCWPTCM